MRLLLGLSARYPCHTIKIYVADEINRIGISSFIMPLLTTEKFPGHSEPANNAKSNARALSQALHPSYVTHV